MVKLYTDNHLKFTGISDLIKLIQIAGERANLELKVDNRLSEGVFIFIDEFSSGYELKKLVKQKRLKSLKYILLCTEFETNGSCGLSFNEFENLKTGLSGLIRFLGHILFWTPKVIRKSRILGKITAVGGLLIITPFLVVYKYTNFQEIVSLISDLKRRVYMKARRKGYEKFKTIADLELKIHPLTSNDSKADVLLPTIDSFEHTSKGNIKVSGTETVYRLKKCNKFKNLLEQRSMDFRFDYNGTIKFDAVERTQIYEFAYQPAQSENWDKSNPVKIWRDMHYHGALPILDKKFHDHHIEDIAITKEEFFKKEYDAELIIDKIHEYSEQAERVNSKIFSQVKKLESL